MKNKKLQNNNLNETTKLSSEVLKRIDKITPDSKWKLTCVNYLVWSAWAFSVLFGAISVAVLIYVGDRARFALFEATHDTSLSFYTEILPYMWIGTFLAMGVFAYFNMRNTKSGYKYPIWKLAISSIVFSVVGGAILQTFDMGYIIDTQLAKNMPMYTSLEYSEQRMWQKSEDGRLLGAFDASSKNEGIYAFMDIDKKQWTIQTSELKQRDIELIESGYKVRLLGTTTDSEKQLFHACGVFPWLFDKNISTETMRTDRKEFVERMYQHMEQGERLEEFEREVFSEGSQEQFEEGICYKLATVKRMKF